MRQKQYFCVMFQQNREIFGKIIHHSPKIVKSAVLSKGGFPLSRKFYVRRDVNLAGFTYVNRIRNDVRAACVNVKS